MSYSDIQKYQYKKGQSGNVKGRPKGSISFKTILNKILSGQIEIEEAGKKYKVTKAEAMILQMVVIILNKKTDDETRLKYIKEIIDRVDGKAKQEVDLDNINNLSVNINHFFDEIPKCSRQNKQNS